jgi:acyl carrier protein
LTGFLFGLPLITDYFNSEGFLEMPDIAARVKKIVVDHLGIDAEKVTTEASLIDDLGADSLDTVELVMAFEEEFGIEIPEAEADEMSTVGEIIAYVKKAKP